MGEPWVADEELGFYSQISMDWILSFSSIPYYLWTLPRLCNLSGSQDHHLHKGNAEHSRGMVLLWLLQGCSKIMLVWPCLPSSKHSLHANSSFYIILHTKSLRSLLCTRNKLGHHNQRWESTSTGFDKSADQQPDGEVSWSTGTPPGLTANSQQRASQERAARESQSLTVAFPVTNGAPEC